MNKEQIIQEAKQAIDKLQSLIKQVETEKESKYFDLSKLKCELEIKTGKLFSGASAEKAGLHGSTFMLIRNSHEYAYKGFFLSSGVDWQIITDSEGSKVLLPTKKT